MPDFAADRVSPSDLAKVDYVITGDTAGPYHSAMNFPRVELQLRDAGFILTWTKVLSNSNSIKLWHRK